MTERPSAARLAEILREHKADTYSADFDERIAIDDLFAEITALLEEVARSVLRETPP